MAISLWGVIFIYSERILLLIYMVLQFMWRKNLLLSLCTVFDSVSFIIDEVLSINQSAYVFFFGDIKVHRKDALTYSGGTGRPGELCYNFSISNDLTQMINFPTRIRDCDSHSHGSE